MNEKTETTKRLSINDLLATSEFQNSKMKLPCALGVTENGEPLLFDLAQMAHILIGGATGAGKSTSLHAMLSSLLQKKSPEELKLVLIDPKQVELTNYETLSSLYLARLPYKEEPIITDVRDAVNALNSLNELMYERYSLLRKNKCKNIKDYNDKCKKGVIPSLPSQGMMPYYVIIIDEIGDYMMSAGKDFERPLTCLAQLSRAVGIHTVITTQRTEDVVITGAIKANYPCRIAFKTTTKKYSKAVMDFPGAEQLSNNGDFLITTGKEPLLVHGAFVDENNDIPALCAKLTQQYDKCVPAILPEIKDEEKGTGKDVTSIGEFVFQYADPLFEKVVKAIVENQCPSISFVQRTFSIGYNRASNLLDMAESAGIVSPEKKHTCEREVLIADTHELMHRLLDIKMEIYKDVERKLFI